jgi:hypothetical protein
LGEEHWMLLPIFPYAKCLSGVEGVPIISMVTWGSWHSTMASESWSWGEARVARGLCQAGPQARKGLGRGRSGVRHTSTVLAIDPVSQFQSEKWKRQHMHTLSHWDPFTAQQNFSLWSVKSVLCRVTPVDRMSAPGGSLVVAHAWYTSSVDLHWQLWQLFGKETRLTWTHFSGLTLPWV